MPMPGVPRTEDAGTKQSRNDTLAIGEVRSPILGIAGPTLRPGADASARKQVSPNGPRRSVLTAKVTNTSATGAFVMNVFSPFSSQPPPAGSAVVRAAKASDPVPGSVIA